MQLYDLPMKLATLPPNLYEVHKMVYAAMLDGQGKEGRDFLFAILEDLGGMVVIRSDNLSEAQRKWAMPVDQPRNGDVRDFQIIACPMTKMGNATKPLPPNDPNARMEWLRRRGKRHGFDLIGAVVTSRPVHYNRRGTKFWLERAEFTGTLKVVDENKLSSAMISGIGRGRSLGHGMLRWN